MKIALYIVGIVLLLMVYVRLAPHDAARWHKMRDDPQTRDMEGGAIRVIEDAGPDALARLDAIATAEPRTTRLAGSVDEGMITYVSRTKWIGFPDYTTVRQRGERLELLARLRFGRKDFGVNRARLERWIAALDTK